MKLRAAFPPVAPLFVAVSASLAAWLNTPNVPTSVEEITVAAVNPSTQTDALLVVEPSQDLQKFIAAIEARPLFIPGRRVPTLVQPEPLAPTEVPDVVPLSETALTIDPTPVETPVAPDIHMQGVMSSGGTIRVLIRNANDQSEQWFEKGADVQGWTLVEITQDAMVLRTGDTEVSIKMFQ